MNREKMTGFCMIRHTHTTTTTIVAVLTVGIK